MTHQNGTSNREKMAGDIHRANCCVELPNIMASSRIPPPKDVIDTLNQEP
jgi:hypothetical protein